MQSAPAFRALLLATLLLSLAGCVRKADDAAADTQLQLTGASAKGAAQAAASNATPAPAWSVSQSWTHKWTIMGAGDGGGDLTILIRTVVAETADGGWTLATDNQTIAAFHGAFVIPTLGHFSRGLLQSVGETRFPWYHFPLAANTTWNDAVVAWDGVQASSIPVHGRVASVTHGASTLYRIELSAADHLVAEYDYDSETEWFNEARFYDDSGTLVFRAEMQETHRGFTGRLYDDTGVLLLNHQDLVVPTAGVVQPNPAQDFTMAADQNRLLVFLISFAVGGAHHAELVAPDGSRHAAQSVDAVAMPVLNDSGVLLLPGQAGTWRVASAGAGLIVAGGFIQAYGLHERVIDL
ncbi:MAG: hypothetical protein ABR586_08370 [Thermoplasmatota archaeon]